ncbi:hypothetical protein AA106555_1151 [Neokomagataea thailandica NBRC 106555]|uniref:Uncharacterized protein n=2 Tax=Neokomagataea TaxID=1223423 RepID=A0A4Y6V2M4_9PROT|nr:hypothetical protein D5366_02365 [Neokomagataea tanensis]GBR53056.1 hypothetical protein AA106555_1151 [Neokomagataea thailandica NBRC 106555]
MHLNSVKAGGLARASYNARDTTLDVRIRGFNLLQRKKARPVLTRFTKIQKKSYEKAPQMPPERIVCSA